MSNKNKKGGSKFKRTKKGDKSTHDDKVPLAEENANCFYAQVIKNIGTGFQIALKGGQETICTLRGKLRKRAWCNPGDIVMVNLDLEKYILVHKYRPDEVKQLKALGKINFTSNDDEGNAFRFEDENDEDESDEEFNNDFFTKMKTMKEEDAVNRK